MTGPWWPCYFVGCPQLGANLYLPVNHAPAFRSRID